MKKSVQLIALVAVALLSSCSGGEKDKATAEKVDEKPRVKLASVTARPVDQIQEYTATVQAEVKNNIAPLLRCVSIRYLWKWVTVFLKGRNWCRWMLPI